MSLILPTSTNSTLKKICSRNTARNIFHFTNFLANIWWCQTAPFLDAQELHSRSTLKANVCIFLYISFRKVLFQRLSKLSSGGVGGGWWSMNFFLNAARGLGLVKCFTIFHFNWNFWKLNYFSAFLYFCL